ncbi:unnamed protein product [Schistosoma curassoni]|uniref:REJ domain-containing protein n=1 Tax=Schistosoma curassoni TaxID=6186 RepID=A0A183K7C3_9TREM|nr:unnamed protein product [Schistosoma curassoni]
MSGMVLSPSGSSNVAIPPSSSYSSSGSSYSSSTGSGPAPPAVINGVELVPAPLLPHKLSFSPSGQALNYSAISNPSMDNAANTTLLNSISDSQAIHQSSLTLPPLAPALHNHTCVVGNTTCTPGSYQHHHHSNMVSHRGATEPGVSCSFTGNLYSLWSGFFSFFLKGKTILAYFFFCSVKLHLYFNT